MLRVIQEDLSLIQAFLKTPTPEEWVEYAIHHVPLLLLDHAHCERKAAFTALSFMNKYPDHTRITETMPPLAREELLHFEKVTALMEKRGLKYRSLMPSRYAKSLHGLITKESGSPRLCEELLVGAMIEARSCERFAILIERLDDPELAQFYLGLVKSEARHFETYLLLAESVLPNYQDKLNALLTHENELILGGDALFRFHSGVPVK